MRLKFTGHLNFSTSGLEGLELKIVTRNEIIGFMMLAFKCRLVVKCALGTKKACENDQWKTRKLVRSQIAWLFCCFFELVAKTNNKNNRFNWQNWKDHKNNNIQTNYNRTHYIRTFLTEKCAHKLILQIEVLENKSAADDKEKHNLSRRDVQVLSTIRDGFTNEMWLGSGSERLNLILCLHCCWF